MRSGATLAGAVASPPARCRPRAAVIPRASIDGVEQFRLLDRLDQVRGDPQLLAAADVVRADRPEVSIMITVLPSSRILA